jgi:hypothetical protein
MLEPRLKTPRLNNLTLSYARRSVEYEAVMTDLALMGAIPKETCEQLTGRRFAEHLKLPPTYPVPVTEEKA